MRIAKNFLLALVLLVHGNLLAAATLEHEGIAIHEAWITLPDGVRLAADLYLPADIGAKKLPVLLEYLPYRKDESRGGRFADFSYFIRHGYVVARVDIRGTGRSEGRLIEYEYSEQEQSDGEVVIDWLAKQPFSSGNIGMFGISWGGFNSIQMAMRRPPALKAIVPVMATDDIYQDDVHFMDGIMHVDAYELGQDLWNIIPGAPDYRIDEAYFRDRFDTTPWLLIYKRQQRDGPFWDRASLNRDYSLIDIPTYAIGGWYDGYRDSVPRMLEHMSAPVKGMLGPWNHTWPNQAVPPPGIEWRREAVRWFDHWLKGIDTGIMNEPRFSVYVRDWHPPGIAPAEIPGHWRGEAGWPLPRITPQRYFLGADQSLGRTPATEAVRYLGYRPSVGIEASGSVMWWGDWAPDQRPADGCNLVFETEPLADAREILGFPRALLNVSADVPQADWIVRLSDVAENGAVTQVAGAGFNGTHRDSSTSPAALVPEQRYALDIEMHFSSWVFPKGHRIRLAVGNAHWPMFWPTPYPMTTALYLGGAQGSALLLPVVPAGKESPLRFPAPVADPELPGYRSIAAETVSGYPEIRTVLRDEREQTTTVTATNSGVDEYPFATVRYSEKVVHRVADLDPASASVQGDYSITVERSGRTLSWSGVLELRSDRDNFHYDYTRRLREGDTLLREKSWKETIPRDFQ